MNNVIKIGDRKIGDGYPVFIVAEIANCHEGNYKVARLMIDKIAKTGVDAVKLQLHIASAEMVSTHPKFESQSKRSLSVNQILKLKKYIERKGLVFLCSSFSREAADELDKMGIAVFKIGSGETNDLSYVEHIANKGKPMIVSTGMTSLDEIDSVVRLIRRKRVPFILLHTVSIYPTPYSRLNLNRINLLREKFKAPIGLSDHVPEIYSAIASMAFKPVLIEKHYTLDKNQIGTSDHKVSLEPNEFKEMVRVLRAVEKSFGTSSKILLEEKATAAWAHHSVVATRDIKKNHVIKRGDLTTKRPLNDGIEARRINEVVGRVAKIDISKDTIVHWRDLK